VATFAELAALLEVLGLVPVLLLELLELLEPLLPQPATSTMVATAAAAATIALDARKVIPPMPSWLDKCMVARQVKQKIAARWPLIVCLVAI